MKEFKNEIDHYRQRVEELEQELEKRKLEYDKELSLAAKIHQTLLPKPIRHEKIHVDVRYLPIEQVGGDYCQVRFYEEDICYITMCDVTGHGIAPALMATRVSSEVRQCISNGYSPQEIVKSVNSLICENFKETHFYPSFVAARLDLNNHKITWSGAGHPSPLILRSKTATVDEMTSQNTLLGIQEDNLEDESEHTLSLEPGDRLFFYTDGLSETITDSGSVPGVNGMVELAKSTSPKGIFDVADCMLKKIAEYDDEAIPDDKTLIVVEIQN
ncbi:MAG: sigma-B regulation protein RsbU (phosphoserine phosphatase) [Candidatus Omnitrophota bacterium]|jgi:sigma-B regulation protein RsbU (phosphoserine phosphatase)